MAHPRRVLLGVALVAAIVSMLPEVAHAETYPARPVRIVVGYPPGGLADILARLLGKSLTEQLGQPFIVENRPGAGTNIAAEHALRSPPDGYTLLLLSTSNAINATLYEGLRFNLVRDSAPVAKITTTPGVMVVNPSFPAKTVPEFIAYAKANGGKVHMASAGIGSAPHIYGELFKMMAGVDLVHIPYSGSPPALQSLMGGEVDVMFDTVPTSIDHIKAGELRALAVTAAARVDALPDVPALSEFVAGYEATGWQGIAAPKDTPSAIVDTLNREINRALSTPALRERLRVMGSTVATGTSGEFADFIATETDKWATVVKFSGAKAGR